MKEGYKSYDPNGIGVDNGNFIGLPLVKDCAVSILAVPYDATVSYREGTAGGPANILAASSQLDVSIPSLFRPWELGFSWSTLSGDWLNQLPETRRYVKDIIRSLESSQGLTERQQLNMQFVNEKGLELTRSVFESVRAELEKGVFPVVVGGEHAVSLGAFKAAATQGEFGILQIDAHMDLREAYEGFEYSHASVMHNAVVRIPELIQLTQVAIRDWCPQEEAFAKTHHERISTFFDHEIQSQKMKGSAFAKTIEPIIDSLPHRVWISFDIDGLEPHNCQHTGTPVPGGLSFTEAQFLCQAVIESGRKIIGLDLVEVAGAPHEYEGAIAARLIYDISARALSYNHSI